MRAMAGFYRAQWGLGIPRLPECGAAGAGRARCWRPCPGREPPAGPDTLHQPRLITAKPEWRTKAGRASRPACCASASDEQRDPGEGRPGLGDLRAEEDQPQTHQANQRHAECPGQAQELRAPSLQTRLRHPACAVLRRAAALQRWRLGRVGPPWGDHRRNRCRWGFQRCRRAFRRQRRMLRLHLRLGRERWHPFMITGRAAQRVPTGHQRVRNAIGRGAVRAGNVHVASHVPRRGVSCNHVIALL